MKKLLLALLLMVPFVASGVEPDVVQRVQDATYKLYVRVTPPGGQSFQTASFCSASFHEVEGEPWDDDKSDFWNRREGRLKPGTYGTTAGHCLDSFNVIRDMIEDRTFGAEVALYISPNNDGSDFMKVESVTHGLRAWREWQDDREYTPRPGPNDLSDWGVIRVDGEVNTIKLGRLESTESVFTVGYPMALGQTVATGVARPNFQLPGTAFHGHISSDVAASPGTSGSPVVNSRGEQVGILAAVMTPQFGVGPTLVVPIEHISYHRSGRTRTMSGLSYFEMYDTINNQLADFVIEQMKEIVSD